MTFRGHVCGLLGSLPRFNSLILSHVNEKCNILMMQLVFFIFKLVSVSEFKVESCISIVYLPNVQLKLNGTKRFCQSDFSASVTVAGELATQNHTGTIFCFVLFCFFSLFCFVLFCFVLCVFCE